MFIIFEISDKPRLPVLSMPKTTYDDANLELQETLSLLHLQIRHPYVVHRML